MAAAEEDFLWHFLPNNALCAFFAHFGAPSNKIGHIPKISAKLQETIVQGDLGPSFLREKRRKKQG